MIKRVCFTVPIAVLIAAWVICFSGCSSTGTNSAQTQTPDDSTVSTQFHPSIDLPSVTPSEQLSEEPSADTAINWNAVYYLINWHGDIEGTAIIRSVEELREFYEKTQPGNMNRILDEVFFNSEQYNDAFFAERFLFFVTVSEGSGSVRHKVTSLADTDGKLRVHIDRHIPEMGTADMAAWMIVIEVDNILPEPEIDVVWSTVPMDILQLSTPADELTSVNFTGTLRNDGHYEYLTAAVFWFQGAHTQFNTGVCSNWHISRDGIELGSEDYGIWGDSYSHKKISKNGKTGFFVFFSPPLILPGTYTLSGSYSGQSFQTEPVTVAGRGPSIREQLGLGGLISANITQIQFKRGFFEEKPEQVWISSDPAVISEVIDYFDTLQGERLYYPNNFSEYALSLSLELQDGNAVNINICQLNEYYASLYDDKGSVSYRIQNAKTEMEWEAVLSNCERVR